MTLQIEMLMYSGRPDPQWTITGAQEAEFRRLIVSAAFDGARPPIPWRVGYRGFKVIDPAAPDQPLLRVGRGRSILSFSFFGAPEVEEFLLHTAPDEAPVSDVHFVRAPLEPLARAGPTVGPGVWAASRAAEAPAWIPNNPKWAGVHQANNNCLNYAADRQLTGFGSAGRFSGYEGQYNSGSGYLAGLLADGLLRTMNPRDRSLGVNQGHYCCLVVSPLRDMHYYRQDDNGYWSHKLGTMPITNLDNAGQLIVDPRFCDRGEYTLFVAFLTVPPSVQIV